MAQLVNRPPTAKACHDIQDMTPALHHAAPYCTAFQQWDAPSGPHQSRLKP